MSQERILEILKKLGNKEISRAELHELVDLSNASISKSLHQLLKYDEIEKDCSSGKPKYKVKFSKKNNRK